MRAGPSWFLIAFSLFGLLAFWGCGAKPSSDVSVLIETKPRANFGAFPFLEREKLSKNLQPLLVFLSRNLNRNVNFRVVSDYSDLEMGIAQKKIDLAWVTPPSAGSPQYGKMIPVCQPIPKGGTTYQGVIVVRRDQGIRTLADLRGRSFAFVDRQSKSGFVYPCRSFRQSGIDPVRDFSRVFFAGNHDRCLEGLSNGRFDGVAVTEMMLFSETWGPSFRDRFEVIGTTSSILPDPICVRTDSENVSPVEIKNLLTKISEIPGGREALASLSESLGITGFSEIP